MLQDSERLVDLDGGEGYSGMLNKLRYFRNNYCHENIQQFAKADENQDKASEIFKELDVFLLKNKGGHSLQKNNESGRSSYTFICSSCFGKTFLKVCISGAVYKKALKNEFYILEHLYDDVVLGIYDLADNISFLEEKCLMPMQRDLLPSHVINLINMYQKKFKHDNVSGLELYDISDMLLEAEYELNVLLRNSLDKYCYDKLLELLKCVEETISSAPRVLCHGDLNISNMMEDSHGKIIIVDWEDAFWGIGNYDYCYWLTFFRNRKYYADDVFGKNKEEKYCNIAMMCMILILKEAMAIYNGENQHNSMSSNERFMELIKYL